MGDIKKLCIVGAGFAGLTAARVFKALNYDIIVYEKDAQVGGVWSASAALPRCYHVKPSNHLWTFRFSDAGYQVGRIDWDDWWGAC